MAYAGDDGDVGAAIMELRLLVAMGRPYVAARNLVPLQDGDW